MILFEHHEDGRSVRVFEDPDGGARLYMEGLALYTHVDAKGENLLGYIDAMAAHLHGSSDVLMLGAAGGALATRLSRCGVKVTAVDDWPMAFEIARRWFYLPPEVDCIHADALAFLRSTRKRWPAIAIDIFQREQIPKSFTGGDIGPVLTRATEPGGLVVWNVADSRDSAPARRIENILRMEGWWASRAPVIDGGMENTLIIGRAPMEQRREAA